MKPLYIFMGLFFLVSMIWLGTEASKGMTLMTKDRYYEVVFEGSGVRAWQHKTDHNAKLIVERY